MTKYKLHGSGVINTETNTSIPNDPRNSDWQQYQVWLSEGNTPDLWKTPAEIAAEEATAIAEAARKAAKAQAIIDNLPSWSQVETVIGNISNMADAKAFLLKLARVVYWDIKDVAD